jgi:hypothetical protein
VATVVVRSSKSPTRRRLGGSRGWKGSWVTDGLIRYSHLQLVVSKNSWILEEQAGEEEGRWVGGYVRRLRWRGVVKEVPESCSA